MGVTFKAKLWVNDSAVDLDPFVEQILAGTVAGAVSSLKGTEDMKNIEVTVDRGEAVIKVNGRGVTLTPFPNDIIAHTLMGFVSQLKGVNTVERLKISMGPT